MFGGAGMKRMIIDLPILDCTMCTKCGFSYGNVPVRVCDQTEDPNKPGYARGIPDPSIFPEWCPWEDVHSGDGDE